MPSRPVTSGQSVPHPRLLEHLRRRRGRPLRRPVAAHTVAAVEALAPILNEAPARPIVLDAGCGTATSTAQLEQAHPGAWILGVDQSAKRLGFDGPLRRQSDRQVLLRAEVGDLWRCLVERKVQLSHHYLLYPNPWPKAEHLFRRWHGHPALEHGLRLGGQLELRSNWRLYVEEWALAMSALVGVEAPVVRLSVETPLTPFEAKYAASGHPLFVWRAEIPSPETWPI